MSGETVFLLTEVVGSTERWDADSVEAEAAARELDDLVSASVAASGGRLVKPRGEGDSHFLVFPTVAAALECARLIVPISPAPLRASVHVGPAIERGGDFYGPTVNRTARLRAAAHGGQVVLSATAATRGTPPPGFAFVALGQHRLKDVLEPLEVVELVGPGLPGGHPPLASLRFDPGVDLPPTDLVNRRAEISAVLAAVERGHPIVAVVGPPGVGKSRVALEAAADWGRAHHERPVVACLSAGTPVPAALDAGLTVLDDADHHLGAIGHLTGPGPVIVTARRRPPGTALVIEVGPLRPPDAIRLLLDRVADVAPDATVTPAEEEALGAVVDRLEGLPLAIELAAPRVQLLGFDRLAARLAEPGRVLSGRRVADPGHHVSWDAALAWAPYEAGGQGLFGQTVELGDGPTIA